MRLPISFLCSRLPAMRSSPKALLEITRAPVSVGRSLYGVKPPQGTLKTDPGSSAKRQTAPGRDPRK